MSRLNGRDQVQYVVEGKVLTDISMAEEDSVPGSGNGQPRHHQVRRSIELHVLAALPVPREVLRHAVRISCCQPSRSCE